MGWETTERGRVAVADRECLYPPRCPIDYSWAKRLESTSCSFAAKMMGNLVLRLAVAFRLRMRSPGRVKEFHVLGIVSVQYFEIENKVEDVRMYGRYSRECA